MFPFLSTACVLDIVQLMCTANHHNDDGKVAVILSVFSIELVYTFVIIKSCSKFLFCFTNIKSFSIFSAFKKINYLLGVTVKCLTLNCKCFTTGFGRKSVCIAYKATILTVPFNTYFGLSCCFNAWYLCSNQVA